MKKLSLQQQVKYYLYVLKLATLQRKDRTTNEVINEYQTRYSQKRQVERLDDILYIEYDKFIETEEIGFVFDDHFYLGDHREFLQNKEKNFQDWFKQFKTDSVCELGCGIGRHLFMLRNNNFQGKLIGLDVSKNGIKRAIEINEKFHTAIDFEFADFTEKIP